MRKPLSAKKTNIETCPIANGSVTACEKNTTVHATPRMPSSAGRRPRRRDTGASESDTAQGYQGSLGANSGAHGIGMSRR